jgi:outer membrane protein OmpA-like peptidoglycan-associated protein
MKKYKFFTILLSSVFMFAIINTAISQEDTTAVKTEEERVITAPVVKDEPAKNGFFNNWFFGIKGGATFFLSPLKENPFSWGAAASLGKQLNTKIAIRADYLYGNLLSDGHFLKENDDGSFYENDLSLNVDFMEIALIMKMNVNDFFYSRSPKHLRELYLFGGGAYTMYRSKVTDADGAFVIGNGYSAIGEQEATEAVFAVPLGVGVTYKLDKKDIFNLNAEFGYRFVQGEGLNGGLTDNASHYTFSSLGLLFNLGRPTVSPQKITSDMVRDDVSKEMSDKLDKEMNAKIVAQTKPIKEELAKQSTMVADNQQQLEILQEELEARTNAIKEQLLEGSIAASGGGSSGKGAVGGIDMTSVYFAFNSTYITPAMEREIAVIGKVLKKNKKLNCEVIGNASNVGSPEYNQQLSQKRAEAVYNMLVDEFKIDESRLTLINKGLEEPLAENIKRINRRVDLIIK